MAIEIRCPCGQRVSAEQHQAGKRFRCPKCNQPIVVPSLAQPPATLDNAPRTFAEPILTPPGTRPGPIESFSQAERGYPTSTGIAQVLIVYMVVWALAFVATVGLLAFAPPLGLLAMGGLVILTGVLITHSVVLLTAKSRVLQHGDQSLLFGLLKLTAWNPTQGVVILRNKIVHYVDDNLHDGGGIKLIYPMFGEEIALRVPLEPQSMVFEDQDVLTREYLPITVRGTMKWRIMSLEHFYLLVSTELHKATDGLDPTVVNAQLARGAPPTPHEVDSRRKLELAVQWLRWTAEEQTRAVVSKISTGLLVADQVAADLPPELRRKVPVNVPNNSEFSPSDRSYRSGTDTLASRIYDTLRERVSQYGIEILEVTLQNVRLPPEIHQQCVEACKSAYLPLIAQNEAASRQQKLLAETDVLGVENVAARETVGSAPAYAISDFLAQYLAKNRPLLGAPKDDDLL